MLWVFTLIFAFFFLYVGYYSVKFRNPYKLFMVFGDKGCGKTTYMVKLALRYQRKGWTVYTTNRSIPGTIYFEPNDFGYIAFVENSVVLMDEVGITFDNRQFKSFSTQKRDYFKYQRHCKVRLYLFSQTWDVDVKIRDLTDNMFYLVKYFNILTVCKRISAKLKPTDATKMGESKFVKQLYIEPWFFWPFGARDYIWIPNYSKYFDSHETDILTDLRPAPDAVIAYPAGVHPPWERRQRLSVWYSGLLLSLRDVYAFLRRRLNRRNSPN